MHIVINWGMNANGEWMNEQMNAWVDEMKGWMDETLDDAFKMDGWIDE